MTCATLKNAVLVVMFLLAEEMHVLTMWRMSSPMKLRAQKSVVFLHDHGDFGHKVYRGAYKVVSAF
jgi:hypothetical protein